MRPRILLQPCLRAIPSFRNLLFRSNTTLSSSELNDSLHHHISDNTPHSCFIPVLEQWKRNGNQLNPSDIRNIIKTLTDSQRFPQALKVSEWFNEQRIYNLAPNDYAARVYLINNVFGLEHATKFFLSVPECNRDESVYTIMLSLYARNEKTLSMAECIFKNMRKVGYLSKATPFGYMLCLYEKIGKWDMVRKILRLMEKGNVEADNVTLNVKLRLYVAVYDSVRLGEVLEECGEKCGFRFEWRTGCDIAKVYLALGSVEKAVEMLRRAEEAVVDRESKKEAYKSLMIYYALAGKSEEVLRIWELYKAVKEDRDSVGYHVVIWSLLELGDMDTASKITREWSDGYNTFDVRIVAMMASAYCDREWYGEAYALMHNVMMLKLIRDLTARQCLLVLVVLCYLLRSLGNLVWMVIDATTK